MNTDQKMCTANCNAYEFKCEDERQCIPVQFKCDGAPDCADASDESPDCREYAIQTMVLMMYGLMNKKNKKVCHHLL